MPPLASFSISPVAAPSPMAILERVSPAARTRPVSSSTSKDREGSPSERKMMCRVPSWLLLSSSMPSRRAGYICVSPSGATRLI